MSALPTAPENVSEQQLTLERVLQQVESSIDRQLTPTVLSKLAFKGISPAAARRFLRRKAFLALSTADFKKGPAHV